MRQGSGKRVRTVIIVALVLTIALTVATNALGVDLPGMVVKGILKPLRAGAQALQNQAEQFYSYMFRYETLVARNAELEEMISQMEDDAREIAALQRENDRLKALLGLLEKNQDYVVVDTYIISWDSSDWGSEFTIDKGTSSGIETGLCVITENGEVVGLVTEAGPNYAVVKTVLDSSLEISATIASSGYNGIVQGGCATGNAGMLRMNYLSSDAIIRNGDQVATAGSTVYPRDLVLGKVVNAGFDETGVAKYAILEPAANFDSLEQVFVLTQYAVE